MWELSESSSVVQRIFSCRKLPSKYEKPIKWKNIFCLLRALHIDLEAEESASHPTLLPCLSKGGAARLSRHVSSYRSSDSIDCLQDVVGLAGGLRLISGTSGLCGAVRVFWVLVDIFASLVG